jgi:hypothetical protein
VLETSGVETIGTKARWAPNELNISLPIFDVLHFERLNETWTIRAYRNQIAIENSQS